MVLSTSKNDLEKLLVFLRSPHHWVLSGEANWLPLELVREVCQIFKDSSSNQRAFRHELLKKVRERFEKNGMVIDVPDWLSSKIWQFRKELANGAN